MATAAYLYNIRWRSLPIPSHAVRLSHVHTHPYSHQPRFQPSLCLCHDLRSHNYIFSPQFLHLTTHIFIFLTWFFHFHRRHSSDFIGRLPILILAYPLITSFSFYKRYYFKVVFGRSTIRRLLLVLPIYLCVVSFLSSEEIIDPVDEIRPVRLRCGSVWQGVGAKLYARPVYKGFVSG